MTFLASGLRSIICSNSLRDILCISIQRILKPCTQWRLRKLETSFKIRVFCKRKKERKKEIVVNTDYICLRSKKWMIILWIDTAVQHTDNIIFLCSLIVYKLKTSTTKQTFIQFMPGFDLFSNRSCSFFV